MGLVLACGIAVIGSFVSIKYRTYRYCVSWIRVWAVVGFGAYVLVSAIAGGAFALLAHALGFKPVASLATGAVAGVAAVGALRIELSVNQQSHLTQARTVLRRLATWLLDSLSQATQDRCRRYFHFDLEDRPLCKYVWYLNSEFFQNDRHLKQSARQAVNARLPGLMRELGQADTHDEAHSSLARFACEWTHKYEEKEAPPPMKRIIVIENHPCWSLDWWGQRKPAGTEGGQTFRLIHDDSVWIGRARRLCPFSYDSYIQTTRTSQRRLPGDVLSFAIALERQ